MHQVNNCIRIIYSQVLYKTDLPFLNTLFFALSSSSISAAFIQILTDEGSCRAACAITALAWSPGYNRKSYKITMIHQLGLHGYNRKSCKITMINQLGLHGYNRKSYKITVIRRLGSPPVFYGVCVINLFRFWYFVLCSLSSLSCVPNIASFSGLSIHDCSFGFL